MAELVLTPEEIAAHSWLDLSDDALGKAVKQMALNLIPEMKADAAEKWDGHEALYLSSYALLVGHSMDEMNAGSWEIEIERLYRENENAPYHKNGTLKVVAEIAP